MGGRPARVLHCIFIIGYICCKYNDSVTAFHGKLHTVCTQHTWRVDASTTSFQAIATLHKQTYHLGCL